MSVRTLILVAEADPFNLRLLQEACESLGYAVLAAARQEQVLDIVARQKPRLLLLDIAAPVNATAILQILHTDDELAHLPVIVMADAQNADACRVAAHLGAVDFIFRPYRVFEIQQRVRNVLGQKDSDVEKMRPPQDMLDDLTATGTIEQLRISLNYEHTRALRYGHALSCMVIGLANFGDITRFKGRSHTDQVLVNLAQGLRVRLRGVDQIFRSNVDEFTVLLPETDAAGAQALRRRIIQDIQSADAGSEYAPVLTIGVASHPDLSLTQSALLLREASKDAYGSPRVTMLPEEPEPD